MRLVLFVNNWLGWKVTEWIASRDESIAALVVHPDQKRRYGDKILGAVDGDVAVLEGDQLGSAESVAAISELEPNIGLSILFDYILEPPLLDVFPKGIVNLHPAYLPYNRGQYPNVWSIVDQTPAGTTLHYLDSGIDTGDIVAQRRVQVEPTDTGETLYHRLERASLQLFKDAWPDVLEGKSDRDPQDPEQGTYHRRADVEGIDHIDLDDTYTARDLINILRARTFPPHEAAYFIEDGRKVYVRVELEEADGHPHAEADSK